LQRRFRAYSEPASQAFLRDLVDGFFPAELQGEFPEGVALLARDRRSCEGGGGGGGGGGRDTEAKGRKTTTAAAGEL
jgi:hypothetical protein